MSETTMVLLTGLLGTIMATALVGGAFVGAWMLGRSRGRAESAGREAIASPAAQDARLGRMEQLLEQLTLEVERLGESQRFVAAPLAGQGVDRQPPANSLGAPRSTTPH